MEIAIHGRAPGGWHHRLQALLLTVLLSFGLQGCAAQVSITLVPASPTVGGEVDLTFSIYGAIYNVTWYRAKRDALNMDNMIARFTFGPNNDPVYSDMSPNRRQSVLPSGALRITRLMASDMGDYTVQIYTSLGLHYGSVHLMVSEPPMDPPMDPPEPAMTTSSTDSEPPMDPPMDPPEPAMSTPSTGSGDSSSENKSSTGVIVGAVIGGVIVVVLAITAAVFLYKRCHNLRGRGGATPPIPPPLKDLPSSITCVEMNGHSDLKEIQPDAYETVTPAMTMDQTSPKAQFCNVYEELKFKHENLYSILHK